MNIKKILLPLGTITAITTPAVSASCGKDSIDLSKTIVVYSNYIGATKEEDKAYWQAVLNAYNKTESSKTVNLLIKYGKLVDVNTKAEETWGQMSEHTPDLIYAGMDHSMALTPWAHKFNKAEIQEWTGTSGDEILGFLDDNKTDQYKALKYSGAHDYQYVRLNGGSNTIGNSCLPTTPSTPDITRLSEVQLKECVDNLNKRMQGIEVVSGLGFGKPIIQNLDTNTKPTNVNFTFQNPSDTYLHIPQLAWQAPYFAAIQQIANYNQGIDLTTSNIANDLQSLTDAHAKSLKNDSINIAKIEKGTSMTINDMFYQKAGVYNSMITMEQTDPKQPSDKFNNILKAFYPIVAKQIEGNGAPLVFDSTTGHGGYYPNTAHNFIKQSTTGDTYRYNQFQTNGSSFKDIQLSMNENGDKTDDSRKKYVITRIPRYAHYNNKIVRLLTQDSPDPIWVNNRAWITKATAKQQALKVLINIIFSNNAEILEKMAKLSVSPVKNDQSKALATIFANTPTYEGRINSEISLANGSWEAAIDGLDPKWSLGMHNKNYGEMWGIWPDKAGFMLKNEGKLWLMPTNSINNINNGITYMGEAFVEQIKVAIAKYNK